jgi:hypothetical protein
VDDQIYLVPGEPYRPWDQSDEDAGAQPPRGGRRALGLAGLLAVAAVAVGVQHVRVEHLAEPVAVGTVPVAAASQPGPPPWPQGVGVCGSRVELAQVNWFLAAEATRTTVPVTGALPALVDVDTGRRKEVPGLRLREDQYVSQLVRTGNVSYAVVRNCKRRWMASVVRAQPGQPQRVVAGDRTVYGLLADEAGAVWAEAYTGPAKISPAAAIGTTLVRLDRQAPAVELPPALNVIGLSGTQVVGTEAAAATPVPQSRLYRYDLTTRRASLIGTAYSATESRGVVLWTSAPCSAMGTCPLHSYSLRTDKVGLRGYHLPLGSGVTGGVLSPDGHKLAFALQREIADPLYGTASPRNPADMVVLDLTTGVLDPVPNLELPPDVGPDSIGFSADNRWLIVSLPGDGQEEVYSWRAGMSRPQLAPHPVLWVWPDVTEKQVSPS